MKIIVESENNVVYIKSDPMLPNKGAFGFTLFREYSNGEAEDVFGYDGSKEYEEMCLKIADAVLNEE